MRAGEHRGVDFVVIARHFAQREAGVEIDVELDAIQTIGGGDRRRRDLIHVVVARRDRHRESRAEDAVAIVDRLLVLDRDDDVFLRADVRDRDLEDVRLLLVEQRRFLPLALRLFVNLVRFAFLLDLAFDHALADFHPQRVDRRVLRQRERVDRLDARRGVVVKLLGDLAAKEQAADAKMRGGLERGDRFVVDEELLGGDRRGKQQDQRD